MRKQVCELEKGTPIIEEDDVYLYTVCWRESKSFDWEWKHKYFAKRADAKNFAKKQKEKKPYPYITQRITSRTFFKADIEVEYVKPKHDNPFDRFMFKKLIKY